jgi:hypothetical protein
LTHCMPFAYIGRGVHLSNVSCTQIDWPPLSQRVEG